MLFEDIKMSLLCFCGTYALVDVTDTATCSGRIYTNNNYKKIFTPTEETSALWEDKIGGMDVKAVIFNDTKNLTAYFEKSLKEGRRIIDFFVDLAILKYMPVRHRDNGVVCFVFEDKVISLTLSNKSTGIQTAEHGLDGHYYGTDIGSIEKLTGFLDKKADMEDLFIYGLTKRKVESPLVYDRLDLETGKVTRITATKKDVAEIKQKLHKSLVI